MSKITLKELSHSYLEKQNSNSDWALRDIDLDWKDGGAYALLGPSGCGKTTLLNIVSGGGDNELSTIELNTITKLANKSASDDVEIIFGTAIDGELEDKVRVTIIATGFNNNIINDNKNDEFDREDDSLSQFNLFEDQNIEFIKEKENKPMEEVVHDIEDDYKEYEDSFEPESKEIATNDKTKDVVIEELDVYEENESNDSNKKNEYVLKRKERISNHKNKIYNNDSIEQKLAIPAFKRKNINLDEDEGLPNDNSKTIDFSEED